MKITDFNAKAGKAVNNFRQALDKIVNGETAGLDLKELRNSIKSAMTVNSEMGVKLVSLNKAQLIALRANKNAVGDYTTAVENVASLNNILPVLLNMVNEEIGEDTPEASIDDILGDEKDGENCGTKMNAEGDGDGAVSEEQKENEEDIESADKILGETNTEGETSGEQESNDGVEAAVEPGADVTNSFTADLFAGAANSQKPAMAKPKKPAATTNSNALVPDNFLV